VDQSGQGGSRRILGLTGPIGCGKTTVGDILLELGALERIDADRVVHSLMSAGTTTTAQVRETFGNHVLAADGSVDRAALASIVFGDSDKLRRLEDIVHPAVRGAIRQRLIELGPKEGVVIVDAVRLLQSTLLDNVGDVWVVRCSPVEQRRRLLEIRNMMPSDVEGRLGAQPDFRHPRVTRVIENSGSLEDLRRAVEDAWRSLTRLPRRTASTRPSTPILLSM
jgi:dephospho-CoA kinase